MGGEGVGVAVDEAEDGLDGQRGVGEEGDALGVVLGAGAREAGLDLGEARVESGGDRRAEVRRQVEDDALLAESRAGGAARVHFRVAVEVGDLLHRAQEVEAFAVHERGRLGGEHLLEADAGAGLVVGLLGDEAVEERLPVDVAAKLRLLLVEGAIQ